MRKLKKTTFNALRVLDFEDKLLDQISSYRLVLYSLVVFVIWATFGSLINQIPFEWHNILASTAWLIVICAVTNYLISKFLNVFTNKESAYISALILALILPPAKELNDYLILAVAGAVAMLSKYVLIYGKRHIFNPAALAAFVVGWLFDYLPAWWVGTVFLVPLVFIAGQLILRKMKRYLMVSVFMTIYLGYLIINYFATDLGANLLNIIWVGLTATPVLFFAYIMLTEPATSPRKLWQMVIYAGLVALLYIHPRWGLAPEEALLIGNLLAFLMAPDRRLDLTFTSKIKQAKGIYSYVFDFPTGLKFKPGQFMEWTLPAANADSRGNRRYFTISSSPTENRLMFTVKHPDFSSSFKKALWKLKRGDRMLAFKVEGSFVLPKDERQKIAFLAGGIGVTPFRSIIKYMLDCKQKRDIILLYSANSTDEFAFGDLFKQALSCGVITHYVVSGQKPPNWLGFVGQIDRKIIRSAIPDYKERIFYISGPYGFVTSVRKTLLKMGLNPRKIITDYFPGYG
jgi:ferredoxin-NADP reductase